MPRKKLRVDVINKKIDEKWYDSLFKYEKEYLTRKTIEENDKLAQKISVLSVCQAWWKYKCPTCNRIVPFEQLQGCHRIPVEFWETRRDIDNIFACCSMCNNWKKQRHWSMLSLIVADDIWWKEAKKKRESIVYGENKKPEYWTILAVNIILKDKIKQLWIEVER